MITRPSLGREFGSTWRPAGLRPILRPDAPRHKHQQHRDQGRAVSRRQPGGPLAAHDHAHAHARRVGAGAHVLPHSGGTLHAGSPGGDPRPGRPARHPHAVRGGRTGDHREAPRGGRPLATPHHARRGGAPLRGRGPHPQHPRGRHAVPPGHDRRGLRHRDDVRLHHEGGPLHRRRHHAGAPHRRRRPDPQHRQAPRHRARSHGAGDRAAHGRLHPVRRPVGGGRGGGRARAPHQGRVAERQHAEDRRHGRPRAARRAPLQGDRVAAPGLDARRAADRGERARPQVVADARTLNAWRRWGYRLLPGELFSYLLHMRPAEWPIMAGHTVLGYVLAVGFGGVVRGERLGQAVWGLVIWVVLLNGGTLAINSVFDKDEGDIGYLIAPPRLPRYLLAFSVALLAGGQLAALTLPPAFQIDYAICFALSILYSVPPFRFKAVAGVDWLINMWGFGTLTPFAAWAATGRPLDLGHGLVLLAFCPLFAGLYPLTHLYQFDEDRRRGDRTLALILGMRTSLVVATVCTVLAFGLLGWALVTLRVGAKGLALLLPLAVWLAVLLPWLVDHATRTPRRRHRGMYRALAAWAVTDVAVLYVFAT